QPGRRGGDVGGDRRLFVPPRVRVRCRCVRGVPGGEGDPRPLRRSEDRDHRGGVVSLAGVIARARVAQDRLLIDTGRVVRKVGEPEFNPQTGQVEQQTIVTYEGRCRLLPDLIRGDHQEETGETLVGTPVFTIRFPPDTDVQRDDEVEITACPNDPAAVGRVYVVRRAQNDGRQYARHTICDEYLAPELNEEGS